MTVLKRPNTKNFVEDEIKKSPATKITEEEAPENSGEHQGAPASHNLDGNIISQFASQINSDYKIKLHIDTIKFTQKPEDTATKGAIKPRMQVNTFPVSVTIPELLEKLCEGYTISPGVMKSGSKAENWIEQQLFCVDIDNNDNSKSFLEVDEAIKICEKNNIPLAFYYFSFNHMIETEKETARPKFRLGFILNEIVTEHNKRIAVITSLTSIFRDWADKSCDNADRFFYGTNKFGEIVNLNTFAAYENIISAFVPLEEKSQTKNTRTKTDYKTSYQDDDLDRLKRDFDLFRYMQSRNGEYKNISSGVMFKTCEICGHRDDLVYYKNTNTFYCFSANGGKGGSIIDYLMAADDLNLAKAIDKFKHELCGLPKKEKTKFTLEQKRDFAIKNKKLIDKLIELQPHESYYWNDLGLNRLFADIFRRIYRYNYTVKEWYMFDGKIWREDTGSAHVLQQSEKLYDALLNYTTTIEDIQKKSDYFEYILKLGKSNQRKVILEDAQNLCSVFQNDFDKNTDLFNCQNGTLNLKTLEFKPHDSSDLLTKISNVHYDPNTKSPLFENFISEVMQDDAEKINYIQKALGYALTAETHYETCFILYGATTRNGKSTLMSTIMNALGEHTGYSLDMKSETLAQKKNTDSRQASGDLARLKDCRFLNASEPPKRMIFDVALLKNMLGRDPITARNLYEREFTFRPQFKLFINTNFLPLITDDTLFKSNRINVITFNRHFEPHEQDKMLKDKLITQENISGIFNWCLEGLKQFQADGLEPPQSVVEATEEYRKNSDKIGNFIEECLEKSTKNSKAKDIYDAYRAWCASNGYGAEGKNNFFAELKSKNIFAPTGTIDRQTIRNIVIGYVLTDEVIAAKGCIPIDEVEHTNNNKKILPIKCRPFRKK